MATDDKICFALEQYGALINALNDKKCPFALLTQDDATFPELPGITAANLRNVLIGARHQAQQHITMNYSWLVWNMMLPVVKSST
jgi:hypothetical protein